MELTADTARSRRTDAIDDARPESRAHAALRFCLPVWLLTRGAFFLLAGGYTAAHQLGSRAGQPHAPTSAWPFWVYARWDAGHFLRIAQHGYFATDHGVPAFDEAFFPGYPLLTRGVASVFSGADPSFWTLVAAAAVIAWLAALAASVAVFNWVRDVADERTARVAAVLVLAGPYAAFLMASYSEGLFLALAVTAWIYGRRSRWLMAGTLATLATVVRVNGLFLLVGLMVMLVERCLRRRERPPLSALALLGVPAVVVGYFAVLRAHTGSWTTWFTEQRTHWHRATVPPWTSLVHSIRRVRYASTAFTDRFQNVMEIVFAALLLIGLAWLGRRRMWAEFAYTFCTAASLLTSSYYQSVPRQTMLCFPLFLGVALALRAGWRRRSALPRIGVASAVTAMGALLVIDAGSLLAWRWAG